MSMERSMIDAASGGVLVDKTPQQARVLILNMAANSQQFNTWTEQLVRKVNEIFTSTSLEQQIANLTLVVQQLAMAGSTQQVMRCGICSKNGHPTDSCPTLYEESNNEQVNAMGGFQGQNGFQRKYDPFSNTYNLGGETILILVMEGINKQWGLIQVSTVLWGSSNQGNNNLINLNRVQAQHWMKLWKLLPLALSNFSKRQGPPSRILKHK